MAEIARKIALLDLDAFFASAEELRNPKLKNRPFAVGGGGERGVVATANYLARQYGVRSAMPGSQARKLCPQLTFVKPDGSYYRELSNQVLDVLYEVTHRVEPASIDEFYLDLTHNELYRGSATLTMNAVRERIRSLGITGSAGISNQKMVAKIASEERKPDGQFVVPPDDVFGYIAKLNLKQIPGVGPKSQQVLTNYGLMTGKDIQNIELRQLQEILGEKAGYVLFERCHGRDKREVVTERIRKSVGVEQTLTSDMKLESTAQTYVQENLLPKLRERMKVKHWREQPIRSQTLKLKFSDFTQTTVSRSTQFVSPSLFYELLSEAWQRGKRKGVRLLGISAALPDPSEQLQLELELD
ncbi:DNA polymerase IV [Idiomarina zobellii]|uniref:DNA polymerase IV n=1 Tax=Idiomarina zobellii TaxID=86103 RepID=A0A837NIA3_9GAMM|nr:DNA polymerase IV [Idiomarina zobellii]KPD24421.1 nucleotidyltransferase [Idiomarina zobellii]SDF69625.1 DNA polymerase-4 [Idiomarina zobellii]